MCLWEALEEGLQQRVSRWGWWQSLPAGPPVCRTRSVICSLDFMGLNSQDYPPRRTVSLILITIILTTLIKCSLPTGP